MKNEIVRKLTSLTLMTIMVAGGLTFAIPGVMPEAHAAHNANLFVSAENSFSSSTFSGPMVIEVIVNDSDIRTLDDSHGEPDVTVNGDKLRMLQATDGNWYAYFADRLQAQTADATQPGIGTITAGQDNSTRPGKGLNFGKFCDKNSGITVLGFSVSETEGVALPSNATLAFGTAGGSVNGTDGTANFITCSTTGQNSGFDSANNKEMNVVRENKTLNQGIAAGVSVGQLGLRDSNYWPFIQLYDFNPTGTAKIVYNKGGDVQTTTLTFDSMSGIDLSVDRPTKYPKGAQVHVTLQDFQLNIDPTDEDSWTWGANVRITTTNKTLFYQLFNQTGLADADSGATFQATDLMDSGTGYSRVGSVGAQNLIGNLSSMMFEDNGIFTINNNTQEASEDVLVVVDNADVAYFVEPGQSTTEGLRTNVISHASIPVTFTETSPNSGIFTTTDENDISLIQTRENSPRGVTATIEYNELQQSIRVGQSFGDIQMDETAVGEEWNSGEIIPVTLVDVDANKNSQVDEDLDLNVNSTSLVPSVTIGSPLTIPAGANGTIFNAYRLNQEAGNALAAQPSGNLDYWAAGNDVQSFSQRYIFTPAFTNANETFVDLDIRTSGREMPALFIDYNGATLGDVKSVVQDPRGSTAGKFKGLGMINIDFRSITANVDDGANPGFNATKIYLAVQTDGTDLTFQDVLTLDQDIFFLSLANVTLGNSTNLQALVNLNDTIDSNGGSAYANIYDITGMNDSDQVGLLIHFDTDDTAFPALGTATRPIVADLFSFGFSNDGITTSDRTNNMIVRMELEETGDNTSTFAGELEYKMLNQVNILKATTYTSLTTIDDSPTIIVHEDLTDEDSVRVDYNDAAGDGSVLPIADQQEAPTHSGVVEFDFDTYKVADTVTITLTDQDLNVDTEVIDIFTVVNANSTDLDGTIIADDEAYDQVGAAGYGTNSNDENFGRLMDVTFDDERWLSKEKSAGGTAQPCVGTYASSSEIDGLAASGFTLVETGVNTGIFKGDFALPAQYCSRNNNAIRSVTGTDIEVNYVDYRDASGEIIEVGDGAGIRANTGSVSLDRTVYPVPWGQISDFSSPTGNTPNSRSLFPIHATGISTDGTLDINAETLGDGRVTIHVRVNDPDFDLSPTGSDNINQNATSGGTTQPYGPVKVMVQRGNDFATLATAGADTAATGLITNGQTVVNGQTRELGPISEIAPDAGIFELDFEIDWTDGPQSTLCPLNVDSYDALKRQSGVGPGETSEDTRFFATTVSTDTAGTGQFALNSTNNGRHCILQGDILTVEYTDETDASGQQNTVTDSATFDLRNGVLQSDKSVYIIGSDMILTLIEPDFDRESDAAETYDLDLIEWDSDAAEITMGNLASVRGTSSDSLAFDPEPSDFRETGDSTGIFQIVIEIPATLNNENLDRGEKVELEYTDWGPSGANFVGEEDQDINLVVFTSNFGATVELDQKVYTWTDKVFITIVAPDHNFDSNLIDNVGNTNEDKIIVQTRNNKLELYELVETGTDTGIFTGEVILKGFIHDADGNTSTGDSNGNEITTSSTATGSGPTGGQLSADDDDGITVSFEFNEDETVVGSALIRWNIGEVSWLEASYPATGTGVVRIVDPDMNLNPESVDNFKVDIWSDSDAGGIDLTVTETNEATGIFEGTVFFTTDDESSGHRLRVSEGDTITAEYEDNTLPDPYTRADELDITSTSIIGTIVPPLERAPAANARVVDAFGNSLTDVRVDQQVQVAADLSNGQDREQSFAYLVQIQDGNGVTVSLAWITGSLAAGQSFSPALSWIPDVAGTYTATVFVWESVDNPTALSPTVSETITVS